MPTRIENFLDLGPFFEGLTDFFSFGVKNPRKRETYTPPLMEDGGAIASYWENVGEYIKKVEQYICENPLEE